MNKLTVYKFEWMGTYAYVDSVYEASFSYFLSCSKIFPSSEQVLLHQ